MTQIEESAVRQQLAEIVGSTDFTASERLKGFLAYIVEMTLQGKQNLLKAYTIAVDVFGMPTDFDSRINPMVRMEASRLRSKLDHYYLQNPHAPIHISIPKGSYHAAFNPNSLQKDRVSKISSSAIFKNDDSYLSSIMLVPLVNVSETREASSFINGLSSELNNALTKFKQLKIIDCTTPLGPYLPENNKARARFVLKGGVQIEDVLCKVYISLIDTKTNYNIWASKFEGDLEKKQIFALQEKIAEEVIFNISDDFGLINRTLLQEYTEGNSSSSIVQQAHVVYWHFASSMDLKAFRPTLKVVELAAKKEPNNAHVQAMLADICALDYEWGFDSIEQALNKSLQLASSAISIDPECQLAHLTLAFNYFLRGDRERLFHNGLKAYKLNPSSGNTLACLAQWYGIMGNWEGTMELLEKLIEQSPSYPGWCAAILSLYHYVHKNPEAALQEAEKVMMPETPWDPMFRMFSSAALGNEQALASALADMRVLYPDFKKIGKNIIQRFIPNPTYFKQICRDLKNSDVLS